jgi:hypothetical protein
MFGNNVLSNIVLRQCFDNDNVIDDNVCNNVVNKQC